MKHRERRKIIKGPHARLATDAEYRAARTQDGTQLRADVPDDSTFIGRTNGMIHDGPIPVADVVSHLTWAANVWAFTLADGRTGYTSDATFLRKVK